MRSLALLLLITSLNFFSTNMFGYDSDCMDNFLNAVPSLVSEDTNLSLISKPTWDEVLGIIHSLNADSALGPDGLAGNFLLNLLV